MKPKAKGKSKKTLKRSKESETKRGEFPKAPPQIAKLVRATNGRFVNFAGPGRPKGSIKYKELIEGALQMQSVIVRMPDGKEHIVSGKFRMIMGLVDLAINGPTHQGVKQRAIDSVMSRVEGLPVQAIKNLGDGTGKLNITINRQGIKDDSDVEVKTERTEPTEPQNPK